MDAHEIKLRGGWSMQQGSDSIAPAGRLALPVRSSDLPEGILWLTRRFHRPSRPFSGRVSVRLVQTPGIRSIRLNGASLAPPAHESVDHTIPLAGLMPDNELVLEADPPRDGSEWGRISLVFRPHP